MALRRLRNDAGLVPVHGTVELRERPAADHRGRLQSHFLSRDFEAHPFALLWQGTDEAALTGVVFAPGDDVVAPVSPVLPFAGVPLEHDLLRRIGWIEIHVSKQRVSAADAQAGVSALKKVLAQSGRRAHRRLFAAENGVFRPADEVPMAVDAAVAGRLRPGGDGVIDPHELRPRRLLRLLRVRTVVVLHLRNLGVDLLAESGDLRLHALQLRRLLRRRNRARSAPAERRCRRGRVRRGC